MLGENGAGKTTLMRIAFGLVQPDAGSITLDGRPVHFATPKDAIRAGVGMVHQHFTIVDAMTVAENVALGNRGRLDLLATSARIREVTSLTGMQLDSSAPAGSLGVAAKQQLEIVKALTRDPRVLILDEPTAALPPAEASSLLGRLRALCANGLSVVLITHRIREALSVADDVTVLRRGRVGVAAPASALDEATLAREMLGSAEESAGPRVTESRGQAPVAPQILRAERIEVLDESGVTRVLPTTLEVRGGEVIGIAGVEGSGVRELLRALSGHLPVAGGVIQRPRRIGFIPEDRHREALALSLSVVENVALRGAGTRRGLLRWRQFRTLAEKLVSEFDIRTPSLDAPVSVLSGGNQQRLVLARELADNPDLVVAENPTRGLDARATAAIHARFRAARDEGMGIVLYSSDLDELVSLCDRVFAMYAGSLVATPNDRDAIGEAMLGTRRSPGE